MERRKASPLSSTAFFVVLLALAAPMPLVAGGKSGSKLPLGRNTVPTLSGCRGTIAECLAADEFNLAAEVSRRALATSIYISYNALRRDTVPCSRRGASYYNCRLSASVNPYSRSCSAITRCRG